MTTSHNDTICAVATPSGQGGIGIVRVSGPNSLVIAKQITGIDLTPRYAHYCKFKSSNNQIIEQGIALFFNSPNSFTGEDILELQGHGGSFSIQTLLKRVLQCGARLAAPGEFSERAFLNGKIDLVQAEAIADLIEASSQQAAKSALRTLDGEFSRKIHELVSMLVATRVEVEAAIDFSDEDIDLQTLSTIADYSKQASKALDEIVKTAEQGALLKKGVTVAIAGKPNAGKSSLLNRLAQTDRAIVTDIPGTTRDLLSELITLDGLPLNVIDTAGLRRTNDPVESEGVKRANSAVASADAILLVIDISDENTEISTTIDEVIGFLELPDIDLRDLIKRSTIVLNKIDLADNREFETQFIIHNETVKAISISAKNGIGIDQLKECLKKSVNYLSTAEEGFIARERHLIALANAKKSLDLASVNVSEHSHWDLLAEELRIAQQELNKITGDFTSDDLLGEIFSNFCVGK